MAISESINCRIINIFGSRGWFSQQENSNEPDNSDNVNEWRRVLEYAHMENKNPDDGECQTMEIENLRKEKTIKKGLMTNARRALLVRLTEEQKTQRR